MAKKLFVGNIAYGAGVKDLENIFSQFGELSSVILVTEKDKESPNFGKSKGFGFVEFANDADADVALEKLNGFKVDERPLFVNEARPQQDRR